MTMPSSSASSARMSRSAVESAPPETATTTGPGAKIWCARMYSRTAARIAEGVTGGWGGDRTHEPAGYESAALPLSYPASQASILEFERASFGRETCSELLLGQEPLPLITVSARRQDVLDRVGAAARKGDPMIGLESIALAAIGAGPVPPLHELNPFSGRIRADRAKFAGAPS